MVANPPHSTCTCGDPADHVIMRRRTADGIGVLLWDDGAVTGIDHCGLRGVPVRRPRDEAAILRARRAGRLFMGELCLYGAAELGELYVAATRAAELDGLPGTVRRILRERRARTVHPPLSWVVTHADRDGRPTERFARLPRLRWPRMIVVDYCGGPGSKHGRYVLLDVVQERAGGMDLVTRETGLAFRRLADLWKHLESL